MFEDIPTCDDPWNIKRDVSAEDIGMTSVSGPVPIQQFSFVRLDNKSERLRAKAFDWSDSNIQRYFHNEMAANIRGGLYAPVQSTQNLVPLFIPSLDRPELFNKRLAFMDCLLNNCRMNSLRGRLDMVTEYVKSM